MKYKNIFRFQKLWDEQRQMHVFHLMNNYIMLRRRWGVNSEKKQKKTKQQNHQNHHYYHQQQQQQQQKYKQYIFTKDRTRNIVQIGTQKIIIFLLPNSNYSIKVFFSIFFFPEKCHLPLQVLSELMSEFK